MQKEFRGREKMCALKTEEEETVNGEQKDTDGIRRLMSEGDTVERKSCMV